MGKGDMKTRRGKITAGSYGVRRPSKHALRGRAKAAENSTAQTSDTKSTVKKED